MSIPSIGQTAVDALRAKRSALDILDATHPVYCNLLRSEEEPSLPNPLIALGTATRVASILNAICNYCSDEVVQILVIGAGLDMVGVWSLESLPNVIRVVEVDLPEIRRAKHEMLTRLDSLQLAEDSRFEWKKEPTRTLSLMEIDLDSAQCVDRMWESLEPSVPTLVVSEVVLAYLKDACALLKQIAAHSNVTMLFYEPLGASQESQPDSVLQSYKILYRDLFRRKLQRGGNSSLTFQPIGSSCEHVETVLTSCGFVAAEARHPTPLCIQQSSRFDEHAAFLLHIQSYVVAVASNASLLCCQRVLGSALQLEQGSPFYIVTHHVCEEDRQQLNDIWRRNYEPYFKEYPAIRKMISNTKNEDNVVMILVDRSAEQRKVLGGLTVRKCRVHESFDFELQRLVVDATTRRKGLASALWKHAKVRYKGRWKAVTLDLLLDAKHFYKHHGFQEHERSTNGGLTYVTYVFEQSFR